MWTRLIDDLTNRITGPISLRLFLQPTMAAFFAIRAGLADAKSGKAPYFWGLMTDPAHRRDMFKDGWKSVGKVFVLAGVLDIVYQVIIGSFVYLGEVIIVAVVLAIVPYLLVRGLVTRLARPSQES